VTIQDSSIHSIKEVKPIDKYFNFTLLGVQILSMSKRIMNEVMCLAFSIGCHIYYQDTDSMHIEVADVPRLKKKEERQEKCTEKLKEFYMTHIIQIDEIRSNSTDSSS
jgi:hypothetical protein